MAVLTGAAPTPEELVGLTRAALTEAVGGRLRPLVGQRFALEDAAAAHAAIEGRGDGRQDAAGRALTGPPGCPGVGSWVGEPCCLGEELALAQAVAGERHADDPVDSDGSQRG